MTTRPTDGWPAARAVAARYGELAVRGALHPAGAVLLIDTTIRGGRLSRTAAAELSRALGTIAREACRLAEEEATRLGRGRRYRGHIQAGEGDRWATVRVEPIRGPDESEPTDPERERAMHDAAKALGIAAGTKVLTFHASRAEAVSYQSGPGREPWRR